MTLFFKFFIDNWRFSLLATVLSIILGVLSLSILQRESFPPVNFAVVTISTVYPGASPEEVQDKVTNVIEDELRGINGIKDVRSISQNNLSTLIVRVDIDGVDAKETTSDIQKAVQRAAGRLPVEVRDDPRVLEVDAKEIPILELALVGPNENRQRDRLAERLKENLEDIDGVSAVRLSGYIDRELQILLDKSKLMRSGISLSEVYLALSLHVKDIPSGYLDDRNQISLVRVYGKDISIAGLENLILRSNDSGKSVHVKDIGQVIDGGARPNLLARVNGQPATLIVTNKKAEYDAIKVLSELSEKLEAFKKNISNEFSVIVYNDEGSRIQNRLEIVSFNALSGMIIVLIVLFLFLPGKVGLFSSLSLLICALSTITFMVFIGANFNIITMIAIVICLGNLVDNSVVISEFYTELRESGVESKEAALKSAKQFWIPFTASTITIISAFIPMLVTKGVMGQFIKWIPIVVAIALFVSLFESLTLLPARLQFLNPKTKVNSKSDWFSNFEYLFGKVIKLTLRFKYFTLFSLTALVFSGVLVTALFNRFELFPAEGVEFYIGRFESDPQTSIYKTDEFARIISEDVVGALSKDILLSVISRTGVSQTDPSDPRSKSGENVGIIIVSIKPEVAPTLSIKEVLEKLNSIPVPEGVSRLHFETAEAGPPVGKPLTLTLRSNSYNQLNEFRNELMKEIENIPGVLNLEHDEQRTGKEFKFYPADKVRALTGINIETIGLNLRTALEGSIAAELSESGRDYNLVVRFDDKSRDNINDLRSIQIATPRGALVPLTSLGEFKNLEGPVIKKRFDFKDSITMTSEVDLQKITSTALNQKVRDLYAELSPRFPEVSAVFGGEEESTNESLQSLAIALVLALFGIFATLVFTFNSFTSSFLVLSTIPLGIIGVFYSFTVIQRPLSFLAFIGVVGLTGVVINSSIILVDYIRELQRQNLRLSLSELLILASTRRLRAVMATGLTTVVGLLPSAFGWGGYDAVLVDITLALSWGMIIGTLLTLIWIPSGYLVISEIKDKFISKN